jgi:quercetin dioxygenase-like cupin family protein
MAIMISMLPSGEGDVLWVLGDRLRLLGDLPGTGLHLAELSVPPGSGPPVHTHASPELFHIIEGELNFLTVISGQTRSLVARQGDTVAAPPGAPHGFKNVSAAPARAIVWFDASLLAFFRAAGSASAPPPGPPLSEVIRHVVETAQRHGMTIVPPPPDA